MKNPRHGIDVKYHEEPHDIFKDRIKLKEGTSFGDRPNHKHYEYRQQDHKVDQNALVFLSFGGVIRVDLRNIISVNGFAEILPAAHFANVLPACVMEQLQVILVIPLIVDKVQSVNILLWASLFEQIGPW